MINKFILLLFGISIVGGSSTINFQLNPSSGWNPPDEGIGVGTDRIISCVNGRCDVYNKATRDRLGYASLNTMFSSVRIGSTFDPRVFFDQHTDRFFIVCTSGIRTPGGGMVIATSKTSSPNTMSSVDWNFYSYRTSDSDAVWADYPCIGYDRYNFYISANMFSGTGKEGPADFDPRFWVIPKKPLYDGSVSNKKDIPRKTHLVPRTYTMYPATPVNDINKMYLLSASASMKVIEVSNIEDYTKTTYKTTNVAIPRYYGSMTYPKQKGGTATVNSGDYRLQGAFYLDGYLWATHIAVYNGRLHPQVKWYKINVGTMECEETDYFLHRDNDGALFYPSLTPDNDGNMMFVSNGVSPNEYISGYIAAVCKNGTVIPPKKVIEGDSYFSSSRYGDYSDVELSVDDGLIWGALEIPYRSRWTMMGVGFKSLCSESGGGGGSETDCEFDCSPNGECNLGTLTCECNEGWTGKDCSQCDEGYFGDNCEACPYCNDDKAYEAWNHGFCNTEDGTCTCVNNWEGDECDTCKDGYFNYYDRFCWKCPNCNNGECDKNSGKCICETGWAGSLCNVCAAGYYGDDCVGCPDCVNGDCVEGKCVCDEHFTGDTCSECIEGHYGEDCIECPDCGENGSCNTDTGKCDCDYEWAGELCDHCNPETVKCEVCNCGINGKCIDEKTGECECNEGWALPNCTQCEEGWFNKDKECVQCPDCGTHGTCQDGVCVCEEGWTTPTDEHFSAYYDNVNYVSPVNPAGKCSVCKNGYFFVDDKCVKCPDCEHGTCNEKGRCVCEVNWDGATCNECSEDYYGAACAECPDCGNHGRCNGTIEGDGRCLCSVGWTGTFCDECSEGYYGSDCQPCPECNNGECVNGDCVCETGWTGSFCDRCDNEHYGSDCRPCRECQIGECQDSKCECEEGWTGVNCDKCLDDIGCGDHGFCKNGECHCAVGWKGTTCSECTDDNTSDDCHRCEDDECSCVNGVCLEGKCDCNDGWEGQDCNVCTADNTDNNCPWLNCGKHGYNTSPNQCQCDYGWEGRQCGICVEQVKNLECSSE